MACEREHAHPNGQETRWYVPDDARLGVVVGGGGGRSNYKLRCPECGHEAGPIPYSVVDRLVLEGRKVTWWRGPLHEPPDCSVDRCAEPGTEDHHFAPKNVFGADADRWPIAPLCHEHHREWHERMDGYRRNEKGRG